MKCFEEYSSCYNLLYKDREYAAEAENIVNHLKNCLPDARSILELGCGTGKMAMLLSGFGYDVCGIDMSESMLREANRCKEALPTEQAGRLAYHLGDVRDFTLSLQFDAIISLFHVMSYQQTNEDLLASFAAASRHLKPGGIFIFDFWYGPAVLSQKPETRVKRCEDDELKLLRIAEPLIRVNQNLVDVKYEILVTAKLTGERREATEVHTMRYMFLPEVQLLLEMSGFKMMEHKAWPIAGEPDETTWGVAVFAKKG